MARHLNLDRDKVDQCYELAALSVSHAFKFIERHSSASIEKATLMLLGLGQEYRGRPWASWLVDSLTKDQLRLGAAHWWGRVLSAGKEDPFRLAEKLARKKMKWEELGEAPLSEIKRTTLDLAKENLKKISISPSPLGKGRGWIAVRFSDTKAKRLKNDVHRWQENHQGLALAELSSPDLLEFSFAFEGLDRTRTIPVLQGTSLPEQAVLLLAQGFSSFEADGFSSAAQGKIDEKRALVDHAFVLGLCAKWGIKILNRPSSSLDHLLFYEQMAKKKGLPFENVILSASFPEENLSLTERIARTQFLREIFSQSPLSLCLNGSALNPFSFFTAQFAEVDGLELSKPDFLKEALAWLQTSEEVGQEFSLNTHGQIARQTHFLLDQTWKLLKKIHHLTLWKYLEKNAPEGKEGVFQKSYHYWNPICPASASS